DGNRSVRCRSAVLQCERGLAGCAALSFDPVGLPDLDHRLRRRGADVLSVRNAAGCDLDVDVSRGGSGVAEIDDFSLRTSRRKWGRLQISGSAVGGDSPGWVPAAGGVAAGRRTDGQ